ncbi:MAG: hypothetical protein JWM62_3216 [Frankiales bacterium]|nr:hypothetical protein [Frankiales bacterium]
MDDLLETATRCPHCRASVRPGAPWCTLCHADLRPAPQAAVAPPAPRIDPLTAPAEALGLVKTGPRDPTWPCTTCGASNAISNDACVACGAGFLAGLRDSEGPLLEIPGVGDLTRMSRGRRMLIAFGVVLAVIALVALLGLLFS